MKLYKYISLSLLISLMSSCAKNPENGKLDGMWQLMNIKNKQVTVGDSANISKKADQIYWAFQLDLLMIKSPVTEINGHTQTSTARFTYSGNDLNITDVYVHFFDRDSLITDVHSTAHEAVGISGNHEQFTISHLSRKSMILSNDAKELEFRKF